MATVGLCVIRKSAKTAKLDNVFGHIFTPRIYQVNNNVFMGLAVGNWRIRFNLIILICDLSGQRLLTMCPLELEPT